MILRSILCVLLFAAPAAAQVEIEAQGLMQATAFDALPARAPIAVRPPDASAPSADIAAAFARALATLGHPADPGAAHQLTLRIGDAPGTRVARPPNVELRGSLGAKGNDDADVVLRMQMLDRPPPPQRTVTRLFVVEVSDRAGKPYWEARVDASGAEDDAALAEALIPHILKRLGRPAYDLRIPELGR